MHGAGIRAVERGPAAPDTVDLIKDVQPFGGASSRLSKMNRCALTSAAGPEK